VSLTPVANLPAGVLDTGGKLPPVSLTPTLAKLVAKFAPSVKFATGFIDTGGAP